MFNLDADTKDTIKVTVHAVVFGTLLSILPMALLTGFALWAGSL